MSTSHAGWRAAAVWHELTVSGGTKTGAMKIIIWVWKYGLSWYLVFKYLFQNVSQIIKTNILRANNCLIKFAHQVNFITRFIEHVIMSVHLISDHGMKEHSCQSKNSQNLGTCSASPWLSICCPCSGWGLWLRDPLLSGSLCMKELVMFVLWRDWNTLWFFPAVPWNSDS